MKIVLTDKQKVQQFACILRHLKNISSNIEMIVYPTNVYVQGMDGSHVSLFEINLKESWFSEYDVDKQYNLGINCELVFKILNCLDETQNIKMEYSDDDHLYITLYPREGEQSITKEFQLPLVMMDNDILEIPKTDYSVDLKMVSSEFSELIDQLGIFGQELLIKCTDEKIEMTGQGEMGKMTAVIKEEDILLYAIEEDTTIELLFGMDFVRNFATFSKVNKAINIHWSKEVPMKVEYSLDDAIDDDDDDVSEISGASNYVRFYLAPKIEDS